MDTLNDWLMQLQTIFFFRLHVFVGTVVRIPP